VGVSTLATNEAITCNVPLRRAIEVQTETDTFRFQVSTANQRVHVSVALESQAAGFFSPGWRLVNASGTPLPCEVSGFAAGERDCGPLAVGGYAVQVIDLGRNGTGAYSVHIQRLNASAPRCGVTTSCDVPVDGTINMRADTDIFSFSVSTANQRVHVSLARVTQTAGFFSPGWRLISPAGTPVACEGISDFAAGERDCGPLAATGSYAVEVMDLGLNGTGTYNVQVQRLNASAPRCGGSTACDTPLSGTIGSRADTDIFSFPVTTANQRVHVSLALQTQTAGFFSPGWRLISPAGTPVTCEGISDFAAGERDCGPLATTGSYAVEVIDLGLNGTGTFSLQVQRLNASAPRCGGSIACNVPVTGTISLRADTDIFSFNGTGGATIRVQLTLLTQTSGFFSPGWRLVNAAGAPVPCGTISDFAAGTRNCTLPVTGSYAVEILDVGLNGTGTYRVTVSGACALTTTSSTVRGTRTNGLITPAR
jgi:ribosomal protein S27AE